MTKRKRDERQIGFYTATEEQVARNKKTSFREDDEHGANVNDDANNNEAQNPFRYDEEDD